MNKEYIYIDGKAIVEDHNGQKRVTEYRENLEEVLIKENLIETIENKIRELEEESKKIPKVKKIDKLYILLPFVICSLMPTICFKLLFKDVVNINDVLYNTAFGPLTRGTFFNTLLTTMLVPYGAILSLSFNNTYKKEQQKKKGIEIALDSLKKRLEEEKQKLKEMNTPITIQNRTEGFRTKKVDDEKEIKNLQGQISLCFDLGRSGEKYYKHYQKYGNLPKSVQKNYTELGQEMIEEYLEEKGHTLVKTRTKKR